MRKTRENCVVVLVTASSKAEAHRIASVVLSNRLAACANLVKGVESHYWWNGKLESASEYLLVMKTTRTRFGRLAAAVKKAHSYQTPEIIALPVAHGSTPYLRWIAETVE
jgi:periplasmic divalent cation tolerance protein